MHSGLLIATAHGLDAQQRAQDTSHIMDRAELLRLNLHEAQRLKASGPRTDEFMRWRDGICETLSGMLGPDHLTSRQLRAAVGPLDAVEAEGLQIQGPEGMLARIDNAVPILQSLLGDDS